MKFANNGDKSQEVFVTLYAKTGFEGESQGVAAGGYDATQLSLKDVKSVKVAEGYTLKLFPNADKSGGSAHVSGEVADLAATLDFTPVAFAVVGGEVSLADDELEDIAGGVSCQTLTLQCQTQECSTFFACTNDVCGSKDTQCLVDLDFNW